MKRPSRATVVLGRLYGALLYAYPGEFRRQFGAEMRQMFRDRWLAASADTRRAPRLRFFVEMARDWLVSSHRERMANMKTTIPAGGWRRAARGLGMATVTLLVCLFVSSAFLKAYVIQSASMEGSLQIGDHILVNKLGPSREIRRDDLINFRYPQDGRQIFVKRVIGLPGDRIRLVDKQVIRNGHRLSEPYVQHNTPTIDAYRDNFPGDPPSLVPASGRDMLEHHMANGEVIVPAGSLFVLGDNRDDSLDSRYWGFVPREDVVGRPLLVYWSYDRQPDDTRLGEMPAHFFSRTRWNRTLHWLGSAHAVEARR